MSRSIPNNPRPRLGWESFEVGQSLGLTMIPGKHGAKIPLVKWKDFQERKPMHEEVARWKQQFKDINPIMITGASSGVLVLDQDGPEGSATLAGYSHIPPTVCVLSPSGSDRKHYWFKYESSLGKVHNFTRGYKRGDLPGVDLRGDGGYVLFPGAIHPQGGIYRFAEGFAPWEVEISPLPGWLHTYISDYNSRVVPADLRLAKSPTQKASAPVPGAYETRKSGEEQAVKGRKKYAEIVLVDQTNKVATAPIGTRNDALFKAAATLAPFITHGLLPESEVLNKLKNKPLPIKEDSLNRHQQLPEPPSFFEFLKSDRWNKKDKAAWKRDLSEKTIANNEKGKGND